MELFVKQAYSGLNDDIQDKHTPEDTTWDKPLQACTHARSDTHARLPETTSWVALLQACACGGEPSPQQSESTSITARSMPANEVHVLGHVRVDHLARVLGERRSTLLEERLRRQELEQAAGQLLARVNGSGQRFVQNDEAAQ